MSLSVGPIYKNLRGWFLRADKRHDLRGHGDLDLSVEQYHLSGGYRNLTYWTEDEGLLNKLLRELLEYLTTFEGQEIDLTCEVVKSCRSEQERGIRLSIREKH